MGGKRYGIVRWTCSATAGAYFVVRVNDYVKESGLDYTTRFSGFFMNTPGTFMVTVSAYGSKGPLLDGEFTTVYNSLHGTSLSAGNIERTRWRAFPSARHHRDG